MVANRTDRTAQQILACLERYLSPIVARAMLSSACTRAGLMMDSLQREDLEQLGSLLERSLAFYLDPSGVRQAREELAQVTQRRGQAGNGVPEARSIRIHSEVGIREARNAALEIAKAAGMAHIDAVKVATVTSELSRNILQYAGNGTVVLQVLSQPRRGVAVIARDKGPGIARLHDVLHGNFQSKTGLGLGLKGSQRMMDIFDVETLEGEGTVINAVKYL